MTKSWGKIKCSVCGEAKPTNPEAYEKRVKKFGSLEECEKKWVCRKCSQSLKGREVTQKDALKTKKDEAIREGHKEIVNEQEKEVSRAKVDALEELAIEPTYER